MRQIKCFDIVQSVLDCAIDEFGIAQEMIEENLDILHEYCDAIDDIADEFNGEQYVVEVEKETGNIIITVEVADLCIESRSHVFYQLVKRSVKYRMTSTKDACLAIEFTFPCLWGSEETEADE